jgi:hypothetical protein
MHKIYNPMDWYWLSADGRIYASARQLIVADHDTGYKTWTADGSEPTPWPRDSKGAETDGALQDVLTPYGLSVKAV